MPNTAKVIYSRGRKTLVFQKFQTFCKQLIYRYDLINDNSCQHRSTDYWADDASMVNLV